MDAECLEFGMMQRFFHEEHLTTRQMEGEERIKFLKPPTWHGGGKVSKDALFSEENKKLLQFEMIPAVDIFYMALERTTKRLAKTTYKSNKPWDKLSYAENIGIRLIPKIIHACERRGIPQNYAPGIVLLYLEHCEGCSWRNLIPRIWAEKQNAVNRLKALQAQGKDVKLGPDDWPEYMVNAVADFIQASKFLRVHAQKSN